MSTAPWFRAARSAATCKRLRNQPLFSWPARRSRLWHGGAGGAPSRVRPCDLSKGHDVHKASCDPVRAAALPVIRETAGQKKWLSGGASGDRRAGGERGQRRAGTDEASGDRGERGQRRAGGERGEASGDRRNVSPRSCGRHRERPV